MGPRARYDGAVTMHLGPNILNHSFALVFPGTAVSILQNYYWKDRDIDVIETSLGNSK